MRLEKDWYKRVEAPFSIFLLLAKLTIAESMPRLSIIKLLLLNLNVSVMGIEVLGKRDAQVNNKNGDT